MRLCTQIRCELQAAIWLVYTIRCISCYVARLASLVYTTIYVSACVDNLVYTNGLISKIRHRIARSMCTSTTRTTRDCCLVHTCCRLSQNMPGINPIVHTAANGPCVGCKSSVHDWFRYARNAVFAWTCVHCNPGIGDLGRPPGPPERHEKRRPGTQTPDRRPVGHEMTR